MVFSRTLAKPRFCPGVPRRARMRKNKKKMKMNKKSQKKVVDRKVPFSMCAERKTNVKNRAASLMRRRQKISGAIGGLLGFRVECVCAVFGVAARRARNDERRCSERFGGGATRCGASARAEPRFFGFECGACASAALVACRARAPEACAARAGAARGAELRHAAVRCRERGAALCWRLAGFADRARAL